MSEYLPSQPQIVNSFFFSFSSSFNFIFYLQNDDVHKCVYAQCARPPFVSECSVILIKNCFSTELTTVSIQTFFTAFFNYISIKKENLEAHYSLPSSSPSQKLLPHSIQFNGTKFCIKKLTLFPPYSLDQCAGACRSFILQ